MEKSTTKDYFYPTRVWLLDVVLLGPIAFMIALQLKGEDMFHSGTIEVLGYMVLLGLIYSLPALAFIYVVYLVCVRQNRDRNSIRVICCVFCLAAILLTFVWLFNEDSTEFILPYLLATILSFLIMPFKYHPIKPVIHSPTMDNTLNLNSGQLYRVKKQFTDYDRIDHPIGETWIYQGTHFLPYEDGLTLHVLVDGAPRVYRLQWRPEEQGPIIDHFTEYVEMVNA